MTQRRDTHATKVESNVSSGDSDAWVQVHHTPAILSENSNQALDQFFHASSIMTNNNSSTEWAAIPEAFPYNNLGWWNATRHDLPPSEIQRLENASQVQPSGATAMYPQLQPFHAQEATSDSSPSNKAPSPKPFPEQKPKQKKRRRIPSVQLDGIPTSNNDGFTVPTGEGLSRAKTELSTNPWNDIDLRPVANFPCEEAHAFSLCPMSDDPRDFYGSSLRMGSFEARIIEPRSRESDRHWMNRPGADTVIVRPPSKSLHLVFPTFPMLNYPLSLEEGFALLTVCRRRGIKSRWEPHSFISFEDSKIRRKVMGHNIGFNANLERCKEIHAARKLWGERTSHVKNVGVPAKPVRVEPKGPVKNFHADDQFCILVSLHDPNGRLMSDTMGSMCIARTNPFQFQEKKADNTFQHLMQEMDKLTVSERKSLADSAYHPDMAKLLLTDADSTKEEAGLFSSLQVDQLPATAVPLSYFYPANNLQVSPTSPDIKSRLVSIAKHMGRLHANPDLTSKQASYLKSSHLVAGCSRFYQLADSNIAEHRRWLISENVGLQPSDVHDRAQNIGTLMSERKYKSKWIVCVGNVYPDTVMVDKEDSSVVYCLAEDGRESPLDILDHIQPIARLAFTSKITRAEIVPLLIKPYVEAYLENDGEEKHFPMERFWLHLHAMHLDFFLYWTKFRNAHSCRRIQARLLEEDDHFDPTFFSPGVCRRFELSYH